MVVASTTHLHDSETEYITIANLTHPTYESSGRPVVKLRLRVYPAGTQYLSLVREDVLTSRTFRIPNGSLNDTQSVSP
jgi:hypothetical protein